MNQIQDLREKRVKAWNAAKGFLDAKRGNNGLLSAEDVATYEQMEADVVAMGREIDRLERQDALDRELSAPVNDAIITKPGSAGGEEKDGGRPSVGRASAQYNSAFWEALRNKSVGQDVVNALRIGSDPEGGHLVPDEFERTLIEKLEEQNIFRQLAHIIQTSSGDRKIPVVATKGTASWIDEGAAIPESDDSFGHVTIGAYKLGTMIRVSEELLNDSVFNIEAYIAKEFGRRVGSTEEEAFFVGDGNGKPTGILANSGGAELGVTAAAAAAITADEMMDLFYALRAPYRQKAVFVMNDATVKTLRKLKDANGQYLWQPSLTAGTPDTILNRPIHTSPYIPTLAAGKKVVAFGDFGYYWVADRQARTFKRLNELYAANGQVGFLGTQRVDGKLILSEAIQVLKTKAS